MRLVGLYRTDYSIDRLSTQPLKSITHFSHLEVVAGVEGWRGGGGSSLSNMSMSADSCGIAVIKDYDLGFMFHT